MSRANMKRQLYQQGGEIFPRLNELGSQVSTAEQTLQNISQRLESAENQLGNSSMSGGPNLMSVNPNIYQRPLGITPRPGFLGRPVQLPGTSTGILGALNANTNSLLQSPDSAMQSPVFSGLAGQIAARQNYGLGSFVKKAVKKVAKTVKKVAKSPLGKAAIVAGIGALFAPGAAAGLFGRLGSLASGAGKFLIGTAATSPTAFASASPAFPGLLTKMGLTKAAGSLGLTALGKTAAVGVGSALAGAVAGKAFPGLFAGKTPEEVAALKQDPNALEAYLRDYYSKLNPSAEAGEVDEFVRTNLYSSGGRVGFREGELAISPDRPFSPEKGFGSLLPNLYAQAVSPERRPGTILPDLKDPQVLAQSGPPQAATGSTLLQSSRPSTTSGNSLYADVLEYLKRPASDIASGTTPTYELPLHFGIAPPLMPSENTPEYLAEYYEQYLPKAPSNPLGFEEYIYGKYGPDALFSPYTGALVPEDYYNQNLSGEEIANMYRLPYNSGGRVGFQEGTPAYDDQGRRIVTQDMIKNIFKDGVYSGEDLNAAFGDNVTFVGSNYGTPGASYTEAGETYLYGPDGKPYEVGSGRPYTASSAENVVYDSALDNLEGLRDPFQPAITPEIKPELSKPVGGMVGSGKDYSAITEPAKEIAKNIAMKEIVKKGAAQSGILGTIFGNIPQLMALKGIYDLYKYQTSKPLSKEEMIYGTAPETYSSMFFNRKNRAYGSNSIVEKASMMENLPVRKNQAGVKELDLRKSGGFIPPVGIKEKADDIPAMLSNNEFVFTADAVRGAGNGDINKGAQRMYDTMKKLEKGGKV